MIVSFLFGCIVGGCIGVIVLALCVVGRGEQYKIH